MIVMLPGVVCIRLAFENRAAELPSMATELEQLRLEAEQLKVQIRVGKPMRPADDIRHKLGSRLPSQLLNVTTCLANTKLYCMVQCWCEQVVHNRYVIIYVL